MLSTMNKFCLLTLLFFAFNFGIRASAQKLTFNYDASGNQTERRWVCINCLTSASLAEAKKMFGDKESNVLQEDPNAPRGIKVAPNPVSETLNVAWTSPGKLSLQRIDVYSADGNRVFSAKYEPGQKGTQISFQRLPPGVYLLIGLYSDSKTESVKLIKI